jgi:FimV-like protein
VDPTQDAAALDDDLEAMFSAESIAAAQAAIAFMPAVPAGADDGGAGLEALAVTEPGVEGAMAAAAEEGIPDLEALLAAEPVAAEEPIPDLEALLAAEPPSLAGEAVPDLEALLAGEPAPGTPQPASASSPADSGETPGAAPVDGEADFDDVEVNLAKAYIDMGDPEGANAILEGMMADTENPDRVERAQRMVHHFGLQPRLTTGDSDR